LITREEDAQNEAVAHAMRLLLAARTRVLSLAEQRVPHHSIAFASS
jgi:hypothetical protein